MVQTQTINKNVLSNTSIFSCIYVGAGLQVGSSMSPPIKILCSLVSSSNTFMIFFCSSFQTVLLIGTVHLTCNFFRILNIWYKLKLLIKIYHQKHQFFHVIMQVGSSMSPPIKILCILVPSSNNFMYFSVLFFQLLSICQFNYCYMFVY